jgi:hypothetical protein
LRYNLRLPIDYQLRDRDVVSLVSAAKKWISFEPFLIVLVGIPSS